MIPAVKILLLLALFNLAFSDHPETIHRRLGNRGYLFSWLIHPDAKYTWSQARRFCDHHGMDMISLETSAQWSMVRDIFLGSGSSRAPRFIWTGGRKCNYRGCNLPHLQPAIENGWFWALANGKPKIPNPFLNQCDYCEWGPGGALGKRQPDNRQGVKDGKDEGCLAILNNLYDDGLKWHDVACHHKKPVICQTRY